MTIYNAERYLKEAIDSIVAQTFGDWELIAVENGSSDASPAILASYQDERIRVYSLPQNIGRTPALCYAFEQARGEYIAILDADDVSFPHRFEKQVEFVENHPRYSVVGSQVRVIDSRGKRRYTGLYPVSDEDVVWRTLFSSPVAHSAVIIRRSALCELGGYDVTFNLAQDYALWSSFVNNGHHITNLPEVLTSIRVHDGQSSGGEAEERLVMESARVIRQNLVTQLEFSVGDQEVQRLYRLLGHFGELSSHEISESLALFHHIAMLFKRRTKHQSFLYIRTLLRLGVLRAGVRFSVRVEVVLRAMRLLLFTRGGYGVFLLVRDWLFTGRFISAAFMEAWSRGRARTYER